MKIKRLNVRVKSSSPNKTIPTDLLAPTADKKSVEPSTQITNNTNIYNLQADAEYISNQLERDYRRYSGTKG